MALFISIVLLSEGVIPDKMVMSDLHNWKW